MRYLLPLFECEIETMMLKTKAEFNLQMQQNSD